MNALDLRFRKQHVRAGEEKGAALHVMRSRLILFKLVAVIGFSFMGLRAADLMVLQAERPDVPVVEYSQVSEVPSSQRRAQILDRNGEILASSLKLNSLYADPKKIIDKKSAVRSLTTIFPDLDAQKLYERLNSNKRFVWIKRGTTPAEEQAVLEIGEPGLSYVEEDQRFYPQGALSSHIVGLVNRDGEGVSGVERGYDDHLSHEGTDIETTVDVRIQHILRRELGEAIGRFDAKAGAGLIMDVNSGELLAAVSLPDFDSNNPSNPNAPEMFNRFSQGVYELGSTFKVFSTAALFEFEKAKMSMRFDAREPIKFGRFKIRDYHAEERILTVPEVFMVSSNIGSAKMAEKVGTERVQSFYKDLGLFDAPDFDLKEVARPLVPSPWREIDTLTTSYGHGIAISPLQLVRAVASIVNGGYLVEPHLVQKDVEEFSTSIRVVSRETAQNMRSLLRLAVTDGTGSAANVDGLIIGGKTGTAEKPSENGRGYDRNKLISSFLGVFPMDRPEYIVFLMVDEPKGQKHSFGYATGGWVAAPAVARVVEAMAPMVGIKRRADDGYEEPREKLKRYVSYTKKERG